MSSACGGSAECGGYLGSLGRDITAEEYFGIIKCIGRLMEGASFIGGKRLVAFAVEGPAVGCCGPELERVEPLGSQKAGFLALDAHVLDSAGFQLVQLGSRKGGVGEYVDYQRQQHGQVPGEAVKRERGAVETGVTIQRGTVKGHFIGNLTSGAGGGALQQHSGREGSQAGTGLGHFAGPEYQLQAHDGLGIISQHMQAGTAGQGKHVGHRQRYAGQRLNGGSDGTVEHCFWVMMVMK